MAHITFYRKYRSRTFSEIVGQKHIIQTLENGITHDRLSQAYIFSGPRGTGKTSTARILAKVLNCPKSDNPLDIDLDSELCKRIEGGQSVDVIELDAASHTGVDHMRLLTEQASFTPVECAYRMFIIDEAHMLSTGAFNALLKTLEEPPKNIIFILATTEPYKIPVTIHSRCQHLHFKRLSPAELIQQLTHIAKEEGISIDEKSLKSIARNADGCMRDAISLLDQLYSFCGETITFEDTLMVMGATGSESMNDLLKTFVAKDSQSLIKQLDQLFTDGVNMAELMSELVGLFRDLLFVSLDIQDAVEQEQSVIELLQELAAGLSPDLCRHYVEEMAKIESQARWFPQPELLLQVRLLTLMGYQGQVSEAVPSSVSGVQPTTVTAATTTPAKPISTPESVTLSQPQAPAKPAPEVSQPAPVASQPKDTETKPAPVETKSTTSVPHQDQEKWDRVIDSLSKDASGVYFILKDSQLEDCSETAVFVKLKKDFKFARQKLAESSPRRLVETQIQKHFGSALAFCLDGETPVKQVSATPSADSGTEAEEGSSETPVTESTGSGTQINMIVSMFEGKLVK